jgi:hypothetical protein
MEWIPGERRKRGRSRKTWMEGVRAAMKTWTFRSRSVVQQKGMVFGFRQTATAVTRPERQIKKQSSIKCQQKSNKDLENRSRDLDVTWQPVRRGLTVYP